MTSAVDAATITRQTSASPGQVWSVLADGWAYTTWVVGACRVRAVEPDWPQVGQRIHHSFGTWPVLLNDTTEVLEATELKSLTLQARGWPVGEATVHLTLQPWQSGTLIGIREDAVSGPGTLIPKPLRQLAIGPRNRESLRRLAYLAEGRPGEPT
ncbi:MAG: SRPBCC family protein [Humibacillus sp.]|nr:SRPBCC family protein [Humibacillus sp.]MDN5775726.1 SRPBCC family protein [Humibacillus sp.]